jgi:uncharacterized membrane protein
MKNSAIEYSGVGSGAASAPLIDHRKSGALVAVQNGHDLGVRIRIPAHQLVGHAMADLAQCRKDAGRRGRQIVQILAVNALDPAAIVASITTVPDADLVHRLTLETCLVIPSD